MASASQLVQEHPSLAPLERRLVGLLARGQTPAQAAHTLRLPPAEAEALLESLLRRHGLSSPQRLLARALLLRWI